MKPQDSVQNVVQEVNWEIYHKQKASEAVLYEKEEAEAQRATASTALFAWQQSVDGKLFMKKREAERLALAEAQGVYVRTILDAVGECGRGFIALGEMVAPLDRKLLFVESFSNIYGIPNVSKATLLPWRATDITSLLYISMDLKAILVQVNLHDYKGIMLFFSLRAEFGLWLNGHQIIWWGGCAEIYRGVLKDGQDSEADLKTAAKMVLHDWQRGRIPFYVPPPTSEGETEEAATTSNNPFGGSSVVDNDQESAAIRAIANVILSQQFKNVPVQRYLYSKLERRVGR
ncbi:hypothetical protein GIB67_032461 [Kingdonia uniflora]|uniref:Uncharacterized protein n=1 Tax=Kingdonia uniflora TaxID=39325 RepID=A0A7J7L7G6_9MAGN|nr:hypothetical protein GIB67_032461 [Kingdonia uniflora]